MRLETVQHRAQLFSYTDIELRFPAHAVQTLQQILRTWQTVFPKERTLIQSQFGAPSLFVRFDCVLEEDVIRIHEIQEGCAWVGYTGIANPKSASIRDEIIRSEWGSLKVVRSDEQTDTDDELWIPRASYQEALVTPRPLIVRNHLPFLPAFQRSLIIKKSLRPVAMHNDKEYGVQLGLWTLIQWHGPDSEAELPWGRAFVLKPRRGFGSKDIMMWLPGQREGRATRTQILQALTKHGEMYLQPYFAPMSMDIAGKSYNYIYRPYFIFSVRSKEWVPMHGVWTARPSPNLRIHGSSDAISGPLVFEH